MYYWQINGNLADANTGLKNYDTFSRTLMQVKTLFDSLFSAEFMNRVLLYVDNATENSGYTPVTTPVFKRYICIKLNIHDGANVPLVVYQFAHELIHFVCFIRYGFSKPFASFGEEKLCVAFSLAAVKLLCPDSLEDAKQWTVRSKKDMYIAGIDCAENAGYDPEVLKSQLWSLYSA